MAYNKWVSGGDRLRVLLLLRDGLHHGDLRHGDHRDRVHGDDGRTNRCNPIHYRTKFRSRGQGLSK